MDYAYRALNQAGEVETGRIQAASETAAVIEIDRMRLTAIEVRLASGRRLELFSALRFSRGLSPNELFRLTQGLASLLKAGLTLDRSLKILQATSDVRAIRSICADLERRVRTGSTFADALAEHSGKFPTYYVAMVQAGEVSGSLAEGLERLSIFVERAAATREKIVSSLIYPAMLALMILVTMCLVLTVVLPRFKSLFQNARMQLPWSTQAVIALGDFAHDFGWIVALALAGVGLAVYRVWRSPVHGQKLSLILVKSKWTFGLIAKTESSRFFRGLGTLTHSGIPVPEATGIAIGMLQNRAMVAAAREMHVRLREGEPLSYLLDQAAIFPKAAVQLARVGEETGQLSEFLLETADTLDREAQGTLDRILSISVPVVTILMGAVVAALIASVLVGILSLNDLAF